MFFCCVFVSILLNIFAYFYFAYIALKKKEKSFASSESFFLAVLISYVASRSCILLFAPSFLCIFFLCILCMRCIFIHFMHISVFKTTNSMFCTLFHCFIFEFISIWLFIFLLFSILIFSFLFCLFLFCFCFLILLFYFCSIFLDFIQLLRSNI